MINGGAGRLGAGGVLADVQGGGRAAVDLLLQAAELVVQLLLVALPFRVRAAPVTLELALKDGAHARDRLDHLALEAAQIILERPALLARLVKLRRQTLEAGLPRVGGEQDVLDRRLARALGAVVTGQPDGTVGAADEDQPGSAPQKPAFEVGPRHLNGRHGGPRSGWAWGWPAQPVL